MWPAELECINSDAPDVKANGYHVRFSTHLGTEGLVLLLSRSARRVFACLNVIPVVYSALLTSLLRLYLGHHSRVVTHAMGVSLDESPKRKRAYASSVFFAILGVIEQPGNSSRAREPNLSGSIATVTASMPSENPKLQNTRCPVWKGQASS
ncbi:hypothetical protein BD779DRAFT_300333 [Infundibulicybe gibba]|nr:hypothetical protein BD779DRAFT_300333 [Infundibulicybe gibba]